MRCKVSHKEEKMSLPTLRIERQIHHPLEGQRAAITKENCDMEDASRCQKSKNGSGQSKVRQRRIPTSPGAPDARPEQSVEESTGRIFTAKSESPKGAEITRSQTKRPSSSGCSGSQDEEITRNGRSGGGGLRRGVNLLDGVTQHHDMGPSNTRGVKRLRDRLVKPTKLIKKAALRLFSVEKKTNPSIEAVKSILEKFWSLDVMSIESCSDGPSGFSHEELEALDLVSKHSYYDKKNSQWYIHVPFKHDPPNVSDNYPAAIAVMKSVERSIIRKKCVKEVNAAFQEFVDMGFARKLPYNELRNNIKKPCSYIPAFIVFTPNKATTKFRLVHNCSATSSTGLSLNHEIHSGPNFTPDLTAMLTKFRAGKYALVLDVQKMYLNIKLASKDQARYFRYVWRQGDESKAPQEYEMNSLLFGLNSAPFLAAWCVKETAKIFAKDLPLGSALALSSCYVDDLLISLMTKAECTQALDELQVLFGKANMKLHKLQTNCASLKGSANPTMVSEETETKVLGQIWDTISDELRFKFIETPLSDLKSTTTRRIFLKEAASIFDSLGLLCPVLLQTKLLFQKLWESTVNWDDPIPDEFHQQWIRFKEQLPLLSDFRLPRALFDDKPIKYHSLLTFCDASELAYGCVSYLFTKYKDGSITVRFVMAKSRVRPLKPIASDSEVTIVRLELLGMLTGVRLAEHLKAALLEKIKLKSCIYFTDSSINYFRLKKGFGKYKQWTGNRLKEVLTHTDPSNWIHIPTDKNAADIISRGETDFSQFLANKEWLEGPAFLYQTERWDSYSKINSLKTSPTGDSELKPLISIMTTKVAKSSDLLEMLSGRYSCWHKTIRLFSYILRFAYSAHKKFRGSPLTLAETHATEMVLYSLIQQDSFPFEFDQLKDKAAIDSKSKLAPHTPVLDHLIIRSNSRLVYSKTLTKAEKYPIILPNHNKLVEKMILSLHLDNNHLGLMHMLAKVRSRFLILQGRREITRILRLCQSKHCKKVVPLSQIMAPLPKERLDGQVPFQHVGLDYLGPFLISGFDKGTKTTQKVWIALFSDFLTRAVHLELVLNLTTEEVLNAIRLFISRRGMPSSMYSDNQTSFKAADKELKTLLSKIKWSSISRFATEKGFSWRYTLPHTPHLNGLVERMVKSVKSSLRKVFAQTTLTFRQLSIILAEVESIVNSRPLSPVSEDNPVPITPFQLIYGRKFETLPVQTNSKDLTFDTMWLKRKNLMNSYWKSFKNEYLLNLSARKKWVTFNEADLLNKIVLLNDKDTPQYAWRQGVVISCIPSKDGLIRTVDVRLPQGVVRRSVNTLSLFETDFEPLTVIPDSFLTDDGLTE